MPPFISKIYGPPGTGKTTYCINKVAEEIASGVLPSEIIYTSFTRAAAYEARDRALAKFPTYIKSDFPWFSTIHSICFRLLEMSRNDIFTGAQLKEFCQNYGYEVSENNRQDIDELIDSDLPQTILATTADYYEHFISWMRNLMIPFKIALDRFSKMPGIPDEFNEGNLRLYIERRNDYKAKTSKFDFTDLIELCLNNELYPLNTRVMLADEVQDCSPLLFKLQTLWGSKMERVYLGADPYQAVYCFIGADPNLFINTRSDTNIVLKQSYRCSSQIHSVARKLVSRFTTHYPDDDFIPTQSPGLVTKQVVESINWQEIKGSVFYLHRTNWLLSQAFEQLVEDGIPFGTTRGRPSPLQSSKAKVVNTVMRLVDGKDISLPELVKLVDYVPSKEYLKMGTKTDLKQYAQDHTGLTLVMRNLPELGFLPKFMSHMTKDGAIHVLKLDSEDKGYFTRLIQKYGYGILNSDPKIILSTIHGVKGREADMVIINTNLTHRTYDSLIADPEPEHRLQYVAVTRARTKLVLLEPDDYEAYRY